MHPLGRQHVAGGFDASDGVIDFERPTVRTAARFDPFDLTVDLVIDPDLSRHQWKGLDEYAHVRRFGIVTDSERQAVYAARAQVLAMLADRSGPFRDAAAWTAWRCNPVWRAPRLPRPAQRVGPEGG
ncbi:hypothetical protein ACFWBX_01015 [Streptomyces sp. NPDC059991]|uniref:hypothetical protein n=1 Tax=Streptomyces sp. NPDC059991 TaxID=3347028 RepID=UPI0036D15098